MVQIGALSKNTKSCQPHMARGRSLAVNIISATIFRQITTKKLQNAEGIYRLIKASKKII